MILITLQWRHNEHDGVSNYQPRDCLLNRLFRRRSKKTSKLRVTGLFAGNSPVTGAFPAQRASNAENVSIWWRHHDTDETVSRSHDRLIWITREVIILSNRHRDSVKTDKNIGIDKFINFLNKCQEVYVRDDLDWEVFHVASYFNTLAMFPVVVYIIVLNCWKHLLNMADRIRACVSHVDYLPIRILNKITPLIARFMEPTWGPLGADRTQVGPMLAPWTLLSGTVLLSLRLSLRYVLIAHKVSLKKPWLTNLYIL